MMQQNKTIAVVGLGTAGIQSLAHFLSQMDNSWTIISISDPSIPIIGIGESTNPTFVTTLEEGAHFSMVEELEKQEMLSTIKLGTKYVNWREHSFINAFAKSSIGIQMDSHLLKEWALPRFRSIWGLKFQEIEGNVKEIKNIDDKALVNIDNKEYVYDFVIDCTGFPKTYDEYEIIDGVTNHALIHNKIESHNPLVTEHIATKDGWMFTVPLANRLSCGYIFNDKITTVEQAKINFSKEINVPINKLNNIEYKYISYHAKKTIDKRIIKNGNKAMFFEPMFGNSLIGYGLINQSAYRYIVGQISEQEANNICKYNFTFIYECIFWHYSQGSLYETDFWKISKNKAKEMIKNSSIIQDGIKKSKYFNTYGGAQNLNLEIFFPILPMIKLAENFGDKRFSERFADEAIK